MVAMYTVDLNDRKKIPCERPQEHVCYIPQMQSLALSSQHKAAIRWSSVPPIRVPSGALLRTGRNAQLCDHGNGIYAGLVNGLIGHRTVGGGLRPVRPLAETRDPLSCSLKYF